jgi:hypothetical protein
MSVFMRQILGLAAGGLILVTGFAQPAQAASPYTPARPTYQPIVYPQYNGGSRPIGGDWWRTYPWSPYNAWQNPYWYPPYNKNYPYPPDQAYPYYPVPRPYPVPQPTPIPSPWGIGSGVR